MPTDACLTDATDATVEDPPGFLPLFAQGPQHSRDKPTNNTNSRVSRVSRFSREPHESHMHMYMP